jgi:hypothetical protein
VFSAAVEVTDDVVVELFMVLFEAATGCMVKAGITATPSKIMIKRNPLSLIFINCELIWCYISAFEN